jgi:hypothetical protein
MPHPDHSLKKKHSAPTPPPGLGWVPRTRGDAGVLGGLRGFRAPRYQALRALPPAPVSLRCQSGSPEVGGLRKGSGEYSARRGVPLDFLTVSEKSESATSLRQLRGAPCGDWEENRAAMAALSWSEPESGYCCISCGGGISQALARLGSVHCHDCRHGSSKPVLRLSLRHPGKPSARRGSPAAKSRQR